MAVDAKPGWTSPTNHARVPASVADEPDIRRQLGRGCRR
jgi:hypothetical protein